MLRLSSALYSIIGTSLAGGLIVVALTLGYDTALPIIIAAAVGAVVAVPVSYLVARAITQNIK